MESVVQGLAFGVEGEEGLSRITSSVSYTTLECWPLMALFRLVYRGEWGEYFRYIADCLYTYASQRDKLKGEAFVHGFTLAMTAQNKFYRPESEKDTQNGYADLFLLPLTESL